MPDKIKKFLSKLSKKQLLYLLPYIEKIVANDLSGLDVKPLKGKKNFYRVRAGSYRLIFKTNDGNVLVFVGKRDDQTYHDF